MTLSGMKFQDFMDGLIVTDLKGRMRLRLPALALDTDDFNALSDSLMKHERVEHLS